MLCLKANFEVDDMKFFVMYAETNITEYVKPGKDIEVLRKGCQKSEFQFLNHSPLKIEIADDSGIEFPDFLLNKSIPLISAGIKQTFDELNIDNLFYKPIQLTLEERGIAENYWLALPPRINCLDIERSEIEVEDNEFVMPTELIREANKIVINESQVGRYEIFKLAGVVNQEIIVTEQLKNVLETENFENVYFYELEE